MPGVVLLLALAMALALTLIAFRRSAAALRQSREAGDRLQRQVQELEAGRNPAQAILESMVEGVLAIDREGRVLWLNPSGRRLLSLPDAPPPVGLRLLDLVRHQELDQALREAVSQQRPAACEVQTFAPEKQTLRFQAAPCSGVASDAAAILVVQDVTEIRRLEGMRREFVANVSHELKTPLTSIKSLVETLLSGALEDPPNNRRFVAMIDEDATRLARLIDDLLELSHIESRAVPLRLQPVAIGPLAEDVAARFRQAAQDRGLTLDIAVDPGTPPAAGDPERLRQILVNLLDNAIKFNRPGGRVTLRARPDAERVRIEVEDTGVGIPADDLPRIFERFYRVDKARSREAGGTGLGLAIVKHLVELHQGTITAASSGRGALFSITLPAGSG